MEKKTLYAEINYAVGLVLIALSCALMTKADFGLSMVVAPAYLLHLKLAEYHTFFTFGVTEYLFQAFLLFVMIAVIRKFKLSYLFAFVTAVLYGYTLDGLLFLASFIPALWWTRAICYATGVPICALGVALILHTYIPAEVYELIVKEVPARFHLDLGKFKTAYDVVSCLAAVALSFAFFGFGHFVGVGWGTVLCALVNGFLIGRIGKFLDRRYTFKDLLPLRKICEK